MNKLYIFGITSACGGIEILMHNLVREVLNRGVAEKIIIVTPYDRTYHEDEYLKWGIEIRHLSSFGKRRLYKKDLREALLDFDGGDIAYVNLSSFSNWPLLFEIKKHSKDGRIILHGHNIRLSSRLKGVFHMLGRLFFSRMGERVAVSEDCSRFMFGSRSSHIIYNSVDTNLLRFSEEKRSDIRSSLGIESQRIVIGCVGRISKEKNQLALVRLAKDCPYATFVFVGAFQGGSYEQKVKKETVSNCIFLGPKNNVGEYLSSFDILFVPSPREAFPLVAIEGLSNGLTVCFGKGAYDHLPRVVRENEHTRLIGDSLNEDFLASENKQRWSEVRSNWKEPPQTCYDQIIALAFANGDCEHNASPNK